MNIFMINRSMLNKEKYKIYVLRKIGAPGSRLDLNPVLNILNGINGVVRDNCTSRMTSVSRTQFPFGKLSAQLSLLCICNWTKDSYIMLGVVMIWLLFSFRHVEHHKTDKQWIIMSIVNCQLNYIWNKLYSRNGGYTCDPDLEARGESTSVKIMQ